MCWEMLGPGWVARLGGKSTSSPMGSHPKTLLVGIPEMDPFGPGGHRTAAQRREQRRGAAKGQPEAGPRPPCGSEN